MTDDITLRLQAAVPKMPDSGTPIAWPCKVRSELLLEAAAEIERLRVEVGRQRAHKEALYVCVAMIERAAAGAIYSQEMIHAMALGALKILEAKP